MIWLSKMNLNVKKFELIKYFAPMTFCLTVYD